MMEKNYKRNRKTQTPMPAITEKNVTAQQLYRKLQRVLMEDANCLYPFEKCEELVPLINEINSLKKEKNAVILAHSYVNPEIIYGVSDFVGDSYQLSVDAMNTDADVIVFAAVRFMGETAKVLSPHKEVFVPGCNDGCSLADSVSSQGVRKIREIFPGYTFVCYINTTIDVKAECDVCVTSANYVDVVEAIPNDKIYFLPDRFMGENLRLELQKRGIKKDIQFYCGNCHVHERFHLEQIHHMRREYPQVKIACHPECCQDVCQNSDFIGSTSQIFEYLKKTDSEEFSILTESGLKTRLQVELPGKKIVGASSVCEYMKSNTLGDIRRVLTVPGARDRVVIDEELRKRSLSCIQAMFQYARK